MTSSIVIGIGSDLRGDDGVGLVVAGRLRTLVPEGVVVIEHRGDGTGLISAWQDADQVIVVDAAKSNAEPGTIFRFDTASLPLPEPLSVTTSHAFGLEEALGLADQLDKLPNSLVIYGIEGKSFSFGNELSTEVERAIEPVIEQILNDVTTA